MSAELQGRRFSPVSKDELMLKPFEDMKSKSGRKAHMFAATCHYFYFEKRGSGFHLLSEEQREELSTEMMATAEGYLFYINIPVGAQNYALAHKVPYNDELILHILDTYGKKFMSECINLSVA
jgi:hypothetical protein